MKKEIKSSTAVAIIAIVVIIVIVVAFFVLKGGHKAEGPKMEPSQAGPGIGPALKTGESPMKQQGLPGEGGGMVGKGM